MNTYFLYWLVYFKFLLSFGFPFFTLKLAMDVYSLVSSNLFVTNVYFSDGFVTENSSQIRQYKNNISKILVSDLISSKISDR